MKSKFQNLNFEGIEVLSRDEKSKVVGGYIPTSGGGGSGCPEKTCSVQQMGNPYPTVAKCNSTTLGSNCMWTCPTPGGSCY